jgi:hypothetical protein
MPKWSLFPHGAKTIGKRTASVKGKSLPVYQKRFIRNPFQSLDFSAKISRVSSPIPDALPPREMEKTGDVYRGLVADGSETMAFSIF